MKVLITAVLVLICGTAAAQDSTTFAAASGGNVKVIKDSRIDILIKKTDLH